MRLFHSIRRLTLFVVLTALASGQVRVAPPIIVMPTPEEAQRPPQPQPAQPQAQPAQPGQPAQPQGQPEAAAPAQTPPAQTAGPRLTDSGGFLLNNVSLVELVDIIAKRLKINYILDPRVKGSVSIFTYGEVRPVDLMPLLQTILRVNGATMVQVGDLYRVVPVNAVAQLPLTPLINADPKTLPPDERVVLNLIFLKYATVGEISKLLQPFLGEGATMSTFEPANLLLILDNSRNMRRTMELLAMFDSDTFASQRIKLFEVNNGRPSDLAKELEAVFKAYAFSEKSAGVRFLAVDRINTIIAVAPNPGIFTEVSTWLKKLDVPVKLPAGSVNNYVYRLKYGLAQTVAFAVMSLYGGYGGMGMLGAMGMFGGAGPYGAGPGSLALGGLAGGGYGGMGMGGYGAMGMGGGYGGMGMGGYGAMGMGGGYGGYGMGGGMYSPMGAGGAASAAPPMFSGSAAANTAMPPGAAAAAPAGTDLTGSYLGAQQQAQFMRVPRIVPNPFDNTLLVQGTPQEWEQISRLLEQLDVPPRQVLIDAKIYEVDLTGELSAGVTAYLQKRGATLPGSGSGSGSGSGGTTAANRALTAFSSAAGLTMTGSMLVLRSHEILGVLQSSDATSKTKVISAPSLIATDSVPATLNVGQEVPVLTSQAVGGVQQGGNSLFTNTISNRSSGVTLQVMARVNSSGIVTLAISQDVSTPQAPANANAIQSPSFQRRAVQTQVTVQDGDTIAIGGIILESDLRSSSGVPGLHRLPIVGAAFGAKSWTKARTELVILMTPRVIYDTNQIADASDEIKANLKKLQKDLDR